MWLCQHQKKQAAVGRARKLQSLLQNPRSARKSRRQQQGDRWFRCTSTLGRQVLVCSTCLPSNPSPFLKTGSEGPVILQANFVCTTCKVCGMVYAKGQEKDEKLHAAFHSSTVQGISFQVRWRHAILDISVRDPEPIHTAETA